MALAFASAAWSAQHEALPKPYTELTLAGLQQGRDSLAVALKRYKAKYSSSDSGSISVKQWADACTGHTLSLGMDPHGVIEQITVSSLVPVDGKCENRRTDVLDEKDWVTGHGLHLGDPEDHVAELYGEANSSGPSVKGGTELEFSSTLLHGQVLMCRKRWRFTARGIPGEWWRSRWRIPLLEARKTFRLRNEWGEWPNGFQFVPWHWSPSPMEARDAAHRKRRPESKRRHNFRNRPCRQKLRQWLQRHSAGARR